MEKYWKTREGVKVEISKMDDNHLKNTVNMLNRKGFISKETLMFYICCPEPTGDMGQMAFEQEFQQVLESPVCPVMGKLEKELEKREKKYGKF